MNELFGINCKPEADMIFDLKDKKTDDQLLSQSFGYYNSREKWKIVIDKILDEETEIENDLENLKTYTGQTLISSVPIVKPSTELDFFSTLKKELYGYDWFFALKGEIDKFRLVEDIANRQFDLFLNKYIPKTENESEIVFCIILEALSKIRVNFNNQNISNKLVEVAEMIEPYGKISFLLSNGETIFSYRSVHTLYYLEKEPPYTDNIHIDDEIINLQFLSSNIDQVVLISSNPILKDPNWKLMKRDTVYIFSEGQEKKFAEKTYWR